MSRSVKKSLICKQCNCKAMKLLANRKARHSIDIKGGAAYKRLFNSWNICDWKSRSSIEAYKKHVLWYYQARFPQMSDEQLDKLMTKDYYKEYRRK